VKIEEDQRRAASELAILRDRLRLVDDQARVVHDLLSAHRITVSEFEQFSLMSETIRSRISQNEITLSRDNQFDESLDLLTAANRIRQATRELAAIDQRIRIASAWDFGIQSGVRAPVFGQSQLD